LLLDILIAFVTHSLAYLLLQDHELSIRYQFRTGYVPQKSTIFRFCWSTTLILRTRLCLPS